MELVKEITELFDRSEEISYKDEKVQEIINDLKDYLLNNKDHNCITAPQLGYKYRIFCIAFEDYIKTFINPAVTKREGLHLNIETFTHCDGKYLVPRNDSIITIYQTPTGANESNKFEGTAANIFQQCIDVLDGVLINDLGLEIDDDFEKATEEEQQEVINYYINYLKEQKDLVNKEIDSDPDLKRSMDAIRFMTGVQTGEVKLEQTLTQAGRKATMKQFVSGRKKK